MSTPTRYAVGDRVVITHVCLDRMRASNRSTVTPNDTFLANATDAAGVIGEVTHTFPPGYEVTAKFGDHGYFHMKDNWIEPAPTGS